MKLQRAMSAKFYKKLGCNFLFKIADIKENSISSENQSNEISYKNQKILIFDNFEYGSEPEIVESISQGSSVISINKNDVSYQSQNEQLDKKSKSVKSKNYFEIESVVETERSYKNYSKIESPKGGP